MALARFTVFVFLITLLALPGRPVQAFEEINKSYFGGIALGGYDAASYFTPAKPASA